MKRINKKGFTLVELLAVIVILGVLLLAAVPAIGGIIEGTKKGVAKDEAIEVLNQIKTCTLAAGNKTVCTVDEVKNYMDNLGTATFSYTATVSDDVIKFTAFSYTSKDGYKVTVTDANGVDLNTLKDKINKLASTAITK